MAMALPVARPPAEMDSAFSPRICPNSPAIAINQPTADAMSRGSIKCRGIIVKPFS
jgi:hypothetical protein